MVDAAAGDFVQGGWGCKGCDGRFLGDGHHEKLPHSECLREGIQKRVCVGCD